MATEKRIVMERMDLAKALARMAHEIVEKCARPDELVLIGIRSRGAHLARRLARRVEEISENAPTLAFIDVTPYRDDRVPGKDFSANSVLDIQVAVDDKTIVLIDDVIYRGRTIRAAIEGIESLGRPKRIFVAALIDRGARELPIRANIVGKNIEAGEGQRVNVLLEESDGIDQVMLAQLSGGRSSHA